MPNRRKGINTMQSSTQKPSITLTPSERFALTTAIVSVLLALVAAINIAVNVLAQMPPIDAPAADIAAYFAGHVALVTFANYLFTPQVAFYLFFLGGVASILSRAEGGSRVFTVAATA